MYFTHFFSTYRPRLRYIRSVAWLFVLILSSGRAAAQTNTAPQLSLKRDLPLAGGNLIWTGLNLAMENRIHVDDYHVWQVRGIDRWAPQRLHRPMARIADISAGATALLALGWIAGIEKSDRFHAAGILAENAWMTWNITQTAKLAFRRARPYTYESGFKVSKRDDAYSFFSAHSSVTASLAAGMLLMNRPGMMNSRYKGLAIGAGCLALGTAVLRVGSGKHFTTDVLAGLLTGIGVAYVNQIIHRH